MCTLHCTQKMDRILYGILWTYVCECTDCLGLALLSDLYDQKANFLGAYTPHLPREIFLEGNTQTGNRNPSYQDMRLLHVLIEENIL